MAFKNGHKLGFQKGQSGNPGGRPKDELGIRELARSYGAEAIKTLAEIMKEYQRELCGFGGTPQRRNEWADRYVTEH